MLNSCFLKENYFHKGITEILMLVIVDIFIPLFGMVLKDLKTEELMVIWAATQRQMSKGLR